MMTTGMQKTGIDVVGDMVAWGAHFCLFYETREDLLDTLISYCKSGLERGEYCLWVVGEPLKMEEAMDALKDRVPDLDRHLADSLLEIASASDWFLQGGTFDGKRLTAAWYEKLARVSTRGYAGMRVTGDRTGLCRKVDWKHFCDYEDGLNEVIGNQRLAVLCTYPLAAFGASQILDVVRTHQFVLARRHGNWDVVETAALKRAKAEIERFNQELDRRVVERTNELTLASEALRETQMELAHANRLATIGQLTTSIVHELRQPLTGASANAGAGLRFFDKNPPDLEEVRDALVGIVRDTDRARVVVDRIGALVRKAPPRKESLDLNEAILEVTALTHSEAIKTGVTVRTQLAPHLPRIEADRIQLQQVMLNLIINAIQAMSGTAEDRRELQISTETAEPEGVRVGVLDTGPGLSPETLRRLFEPFYTTKPDGMGMGLSICRSIIEIHGGRLWATGREPHGTLFQFTIPTD